MTYMSAAEMVALLKEAESQTELVKSAPHTMTVRRLDDVRAARQLDLTWKPTSQGLRPTSESAVPS